MTSVGSATASVDQASAARLLEEADRVELESLTRPMVMGTDVEDVVGMVAATPQSKGLFAGQPEERIQAALEGLRTGFAPFAKPEGVVMSGKAWLLTARS
jgi:hypothetical protein